jgi:hypothetical protein
MMKDLRVGEKYNAFYEGLLKAEAKGGSNKPEL